MYECFLFINCAVCLAQLKAIWVGPNKYWVGSKQHRKKWAGSKKISMGHK
jgi:hypothetical protein